MGAWSTSSFGNDDAVDWLCDLYESNGDALLLQGLSVIADASPSAYLEAPDCCVALAAAEVVAAAKGVPPPDLPEEARHWLKRQASIASPNLLALARRAVVRVQTDPESELKSLWEESDSETEWNRVIDNLERRLRH